MMPEILAPCGSPDALRAAIAARADAVYLGVGRLNARALAQNFTRDQLVEAIGLAHEHGVRVHLAVNTLLKQHEIARALELVDVAYEAGVDGIIVQDLALLVLASTRYPSLSVHASTQMCVHSALGARLVSMLGADRVIAARELSCDELSRMAREVDVEVFVHGALCYCYSGQCLLSSFSGGRSGNRGMCAQPCRKPYTLVVGKRRVPESRLGGRYVLSTAELCLLDSLERVKECHPAAFKIEGRMRRWEYVAGVVDAYRRVLKEGADPKQLKSRIAHLFYRGFTRGWLLGEDVMHREHPANRGVLIGSVRAVSGGTIELVPAEDIELGDGIAVHTRDGVVGGRIRTMLADGTGVLIPFEGCSVGDEVYLTADASLMRELSELRPAPIEVEVHVVARVGKPLTVRLSDGVHVAESVSDYVVEPSTTSPTPAETIEKAAGGLGDTPYVAASLTLDVDEDVFVPIGALKRARRDACERLSHMRRWAGRREKPTHPLPAFRRLRPRVDTVRLSVAVSDIGCARAAWRAGADIVYVPPHVLDEGRDVLRGNAGVLTPVIAKDSDLEVLVPLLVKAHEAGLDVCASNLGVVGACVQHKIPFVAEESLNTFNPLAATVLAELGAVRVCASSELTLDEIRQLCTHSPVPVEVKAHGFQRLMVSEHDLMGELFEKGIAGEGDDVRLVDERGGELRVVREQERTLIYTSTELCMLEHVGELVECGIGVMRLDLGLHTAEQVERIVSAYRCVMDGGSALLEGEHTTGHYFKGVM